MDYSKVPSTHSFERRSFSELRNDYFIAIKNLLGLTKINPQSRLERYKKELDFLADFPDSQSASEGIDKDFNLRTAFVEAHQVVQVSNFLTEYLQNKTLSENNISKLQGGVFSYTEANASDPSRDTFFEFLIASNLSRAGLEVDLSKLTDIIAQLENHKFYIECKRVTSESQYEARIKEGFRQLNRRFTKGRTKEVGIVFVSATSILNPNLDFLKVKNIQEVNSNSESLCENLADKYLRNWLPTEKKILCFYNHLIAPYFIEDNSSVCFKSFNYFRSFFKVDKDEIPVSPIVHPRNKYFSIFTKFHNTLSSIS